MQALFVTLLLAPSSVAPLVEHGNVSFDLSPDGKQIVFSAADNDLYLMDRKTLKVRALTKTPATESSPRFSPKGDRILFTSSESYEAGARLAEITLASQKARFLTKTPKVSDLQPGYSSDGKKIAFVRAHLFRPYSMGGMVWSDYDVYSMNSDGSGTRRLTSQRYYQASNPGFTKLGMAVFFSADVEAKSSLFLIKSDGRGGASPILRLPPGSNNGSDGSDPRLSPNGEQLAFISDRASSYQYDIYLVRPDGTQVRHLDLAKVSRYNQQPVFTPDGRSILFLAGTEMNEQSRPVFSLWQIDVDGRNPKRIAASGLFTNPLRWNPSR
ncbi:MAG: TolB family protein [Fimbriimonas sp.]